MDTTTIIQASAKVVTITQLRTNDVYKRIDSTSYGAPSDPKIVFGIVQDVMHNGTDAAFTALELTTTYLEVVPALKVYKAGTDVALFAATPAEVTHHFDDLRATSQRKLDAAQQALAAAEASHDRVVEVIEQVTNGRVLTEAITTQAVTA